MTLHTYTPTPTVNDMKAAVGRFAWLRVDGWSVRVKVLDARAQWGRVQCQVIDERKHTAWVDAERLTLIEA